VIKEYESKRGNKTASSQSGKQGIVLAGGTRKFGDRGRKRGKLRNKEEKENRSRRERTCKWRGKKGETTKAVDCKGKKARGENVGSKVLKTQKRKKNRHAEARRFRHEKGFLKGGEKGNLRNAWTPRGKS